MSCIDVYRIGEDWVFSATIKSGKPATAVDVSTGAGGGTHKALITDEDDTVIVAEISLVEDANWVNGLVSATFPAASTGAVTYTGIARCYFQIELNSVKETWGDPIQFEIKSGLFS